MRLRREITCELQKCRLLSAEICWSRLSCLLVKMSSNKRKLWEWRN